VEAHLRALPESDVGGAKSRPRTDHDRKRKKKSSGRGGEESEVIMPTATDLATSFLQTEPDEEKAELEAAISSQSQYLSASVALSDDGDDESIVGTGTSLALPTFMANFLKGIVDRLQVKVRGINMNLDVCIPSEDPSRSGLTSATDTVTVQLDVEDVDIEGVTFVARQPSSGAGLPDETPNLLQKDGKRLVSLRNIRGTLVSDATLFAGLVRSSGLASPSTTHSNISDHRSWRSKSRSDIELSVARGLDGSSSHHEPPSTPRSSISVTSESIRTESIPQSLSSSAMASDNGRFDDAPEDEDSDRGLSDSTQDVKNNYGENSINGSQYLDQVMESQFLDNEEDEDEDEDGQDEENHGHEIPRTFRRNPRADILRRSPLSTPRASVFMPPQLDEEREFPGARHTTNVERYSGPLQSTTLPTRQLSRFAQSRVSQSQPYLPSIDAHATPNLRFERPAEVTDHMQAPASEYSNGSSSPSTPTGQEDLAQSMVFSHEDAESMYMSALSHGEPGTRIPGSWDTLSTENGEDATQMHISSRQEHVSPDNLEHALQNIPTEIENSFPLHPHEPETPPLVSSPEGSDRSASGTSSPIEQVVLPTSPPQVSSSNSPQSSASSKQYTRVAKQLFSLNQIAIYLPPAADTSLLEEAATFGGQSTLFASAFSNNPDIAQSVSPNVPGAFSTSPARDPRARQVRPQPRFAVPPAANPQPKQDSIDIDIGDLSLQFDFPIGKLFAKLLSTVLQMFESKPVEPEAPSQDSTTTPAAFKFRVEQISLKFLEHLVGAMVPADYISPRNSRVDPAPSDVLLRTVLSGIDIGVDISQACTTATVTLEKFVFGYANDSIISFDADLKMKASVRDLAAAAGVDLSMAITRTLDTTRVNISTLPIHINIDLQKLDETFSWFGGLSSVLNMGSSMASNATMTVAKSPTKPKGVRFDTPIKPDDQSAASQNKVDARIGGIVLDLVGRDCSIGVDTSAIKMVSREAGIGLQIDKIKISGPHLYTSNEEPAVTAEIISTHLQYLNMPEDSDLDKLLSLITPSKAKYDRDDDILLDTLLRQRRQGSVLRVTIESFSSRIGRLSELNYLPELGEEVSRLATVAKYLPEDDRPGLLSLILVRNVDIKVDVDSTIGSLRLQAQDVEAAQITLPALVALSVVSVTLHRNMTEELLGAATAPELREAKSRSPAIMARMIGDEMEPMVKIKLWNLKVEYKVPTLMALLGLSGNITTEDMTASLVASVATMTGGARAIIPAQRSTDDHNKDSKLAESRPLMIDLGLRDCVIGLNPLGLVSKVLVVLTDAHVSALVPKNNNTTASAEMSKGSLLIVDDVSTLIPVGSKNKPRRYSFDGGSTQVADLCSTGFVSVSQISSASVAIQVKSSEDDSEKAIDIELRDDLFVLETCADSTQTLVAALNGLAPPTPPSKEIKYRTKVIPVEDLLASLSGDAFGTAEGNYDFDEDFGANMAARPGDDIHDEDEELDLAIDSHYYEQAGLEDSFHEHDDDDVTSREGSVLFDQVLSRDTNDGVLLESFVHKEKVQATEELNFQEDHFGTGSILEGTAHRWNSAKNKYDKSNEKKVRKSPMKVCVRDVHIIWNLFDGYDWQNTRDTITKAVQDVETKATEKRIRNASRPTFDIDIDDEETVIGDFLFNSIYIGIPNNRDPAELTRAINQELNDNATETESIAGTSVSNATVRQGSAPRIKGKRLRLNRSKHHKITFELKGVNVDLVTFQPGSGETQSSIDVRVHDFDIFDHVPTSTWKKFATYMHDAGERESGTSQIHIEVLTVKPMPDLAASEIVLKVTVLPLRLHVDQDALDFITRFFEFKDDSAPAPKSSGDAPFIQRLEVNSVRVKLDFKPKRVDYAGIRSGHTNEFMNFIVLDEANMVLRHTIIYGISGFDKLNKCLNDIWMPDIKRNQLPGILAGLAPVRSLANVGGGVRDLVMVPMYEYKKDGRVIRSLRKGVEAFGKTTGSELVKLGAKLAIGTQTVLQGAEGILSPTRGSVAMLDDEDDDGEEKKQISLYADQPLGIVAGARTGYAQLQRDLLTARDTIIAMPGEIMDSGTAQGAVKAMGKGLPTIILRPMIGVSKAVGQTLMGATNQIDPQNIRRNDEVCIFSIFVTSITC